MVRVSIIGANGYTGAELLNIMSAHPNINVRVLVSRSNAGVNVQALYPGLYRYRDNIYNALDYDLICNESDVVFSALPHGASAEAVVRLIEMGIKVIDLSADFRYNDIKLYEKTYNIDRLGKDIKAIYGLPELFRADYKGYNLIANPGCYPTSAIIPLYPLVKERLISADDIIINSASGVSGAGRKADISLSYCEINENYKAYSVGCHRHTSEIEEKLSVAAGRNIKLQFTPHLLPVQRGILSTIYLKLNTDIAKVKEAYNDYYAKEQFIIVNHEGKMPSLNEVKYSNYIKFSYTFDKRTERFIVISALDNLIKGAAGQAVQNMNILFNLPENTGLINQPHHI